MRSLGLVLLLACNLPDADDIHAQVADAVEQCKATLRDETPQIVSTVTAAALLACASLAADIHDARTVVEESRALVVYDVLVNLGCNWNGAAWDCSTSLRCSP